ncbi:E3 ubiquitin-protein ligase [Vigna unguiculata]|uniref:E3 ubiquitin-protein ligase n=1 Tax=Vigna unguiculata TaxID=3917 RepID=A0A4D6LRW4_VIGUN|nr:E3 ubiquitin-protein ligase [Vigna unguiculata]
MTRILRILKSADNATAMTAAAPPPEAVALESDFVVILAALLCALICVVGLVAVARCAWLRRGPGGGNSPRQAVVNKGLKKKVLQSLPRFAYVDSNPSKWVATSECAICLGDFAAGDEIRVLPQCGHGFHVSCIDRWLGSHSSCPSCRQVLAVARCQKCGRFPATASRSGASEPELKSREDSNAASISNCNNNNGDGGGSGNHANHHHSHHSNSGFLP